MDNNINIGVIGAGKIGTLHARNVSLFTDARILAVADVNKEIAVNLAKQVSIKNIYFLPRLN